MKGLKAYLLNTGYIYNDAAYNHAHVNLGTLDNPNPVHVWETVPCYCVLLDHPEAGWILFDTGCDVNALSCWPESLMKATPYIRKSEEDSLIVQLARLGLKPEDIGSVILSHYHMDHAGNLGLFAKTADIYVAKAEAEYAFLRTFEDNTSDTFGFYMKKDIAMEYKHLHYIEEDEELFEGVEVIMVPGHTPGMMGLIVHLENETLIFPSDAIKNEDNYNSDPGSLVTDSVAWFNSVKKIRRLEKKYHAKVFYSHDLESFDKMKKCPDCYM